MVTARVFFLTIFLTLGLVIGLAQAGSNDTPWNAFRKATELHFQGGASNEVVKLCENVRRQTKDSILYARASFLLSQALLKQSNPRKAHKILRALYNDAGIGTPIRAEARLRDGLFYLQEQRVREAKNLLISVASNAGSRLVRQEARIALAQQYAQEGNWLTSDSLTALIANVGASYGQDERVLSLQALLALQREEPDTAIALLKTTKGSRALKVLAHAYESSGQPLQSVGVYKKIHDRFPGTPEAEEALFQAGNVFMKMNDWLPARGQFSRLMQEFPQSRFKYPTHFRMGWISFELGQFDEAILAFKSGLDSEYRQYFLLMEAEVLRRQGTEQPDKYREAIAKYNDMIAVASETSLAPVAKLRAALTALQHGNSRDAVVSFRQFLTLYPKHELAPDATFLLATHQGGSGKNRYLKEMLQKYPDSELFYAALTALQIEDYQNGNFQAVISRKANFQPKTPHTGERNPWRRMHHLVVAESAYHLRQYDLARQEYALVSGVENDDLSHKAALGNAWCSLQMGEIETAKTMFTQFRFEMTGESRVRAAYGLATVFLRNREFEKAIATYPVKPSDEKSTDLALLYGKSLFRIGDSYFRLEDYGSAIENWDKVVRHYPDSEIAPQALFKIGETYFHANHWDSAIAAFQRLSEEYSGHSLVADALLRSAQSYFNASDYQQAIAGFEEFLQRYPGHDRNREALEGIQLGYYQLGESEQAIGALQKLVEHSPNAALSADARFRIAHHHLEAGDHTQAVTEFKEVLTRYPESSFARDAQLSLAKAYHAGGQYESANAEFLRYIQYFPESPELPEALFHLGVGHYSVQNYLSASDYFGQVVENSQDSKFYGPSLQNLGWCYYQVGEKDLAQQTFNTYLSEVSDKKDHEKIKLQTAVIAVEQGDSETAQAILKELQSSQDQDMAAEAAARLGAIYLRTEDWTAARKAFDLAIERGSKENAHRLRAISQLAALYESEHSWQKAVATYKLLAESAREEKWVTAAQERILALEQIISGSSAEGTN